MNPILILSPLTLETAFLVSYFKEKGHKVIETKVGRLTAYHFPQLGFLLAVGGHGKAQFALQSQFMIDQNPQAKALICAGCAGALSEKLLLFDVVAAEKTIEHDFRLKFIKRPDPEFIADPTLLQKISNLKADNYKIHIGTMASGDEDILDQKRALSLQTQTSAVAVAWEGAGGARASHFNQLPFLELRGITDIPSQNYTIDFKAHLKKAMENVGETILLAFS